MPGGMGREEEGVASGMEESTRKAGKLSQGWEEPSGGPSRCEGSLKVPAGRQQGRCRNTLLLLRPPGQDDELRRNTQDTARAALT